MNHPFILKANVCLPSWQFTEAVIFVSKRYLRKDNKYTHVSSLTSYINLIIFSEVQFTESYTSSDESSIQFDQRTIVFLFF